MKTDIENIPVKKMVVNPPKKPLNEKDVKALQALAARGRLSKRGLKKLADAKPTVSTTYQPARF